MNKFEGKKAHHRSTDYTIEKIGRIDNLHIVGYCNLLICVEKDFRLHS